MADNAANPFEGMKLGGHVSRLASPEDVPGDSRIAMELRPGSRTNGVRVERTVLIFHGGKTLVGSDANDWKVRHGWY